MSRIRPTSIGNFSLSAKEPSHNEETKMPETIHTIRSPRLSPLHKFETMMNERGTSDFPFSKKHSKKNNGVPETIEEDRKEEDSQPKYVRKSRFHEMRDHNEFNKRGKRFRSEEGKKKHGYHRKPQQEDITSQIYALPSAYVSENEEESQSSDSQHHQKKKIKIMTLAHLSSLINKKIFSDDFDRSSQLTDNTWRKARFRMGSNRSLIDNTIREEMEPEYENNYLSDSSSSS